MARLVEGSGYVLGAEAWLHLRCLAWWKIVGKSWGRSVATLEVLGLRSN